MTPDPTLSAPCEAALAAIEQDALSLPPTVEAHLRTCPACAEARVLWLAQEEVPAVLVPAGYYDRLTERVLRKLPAPRRTLRSRYGWWAAAGLLALATGIGGFMAGRTQAAPMVEARNGVEAEAIPEPPFKDQDEGLTGLSSLSQEEATALIAQLEAKRPSPKPQEAR